MNFTTILIIVAVFAAIAIIALVLMQNSKSDMGSAFGGGGSQSMFGSRGSANFLSRTTSIMVTVLFVSCLALAYLYAKRNSDANVIETIQVEEQSEIPSIGGVNEQETGAEEVPGIPMGSDAAEPAVEGLEVPTLDDGGAELSPDDGGSVDAEASPSIEEASPSTEEASPGTEEASPGTEEALPDTEEALPDTEEASLGTEEALPSTEEASSSTEER